MKNFKEFSRQNRFAQSGLLIVLFLAFAISSCTNNVVMVNVKVDPPKPDTTTHAKSMKLEVLTSSDENMEEQTTKLPTAKHIPPPPPDTTRILLDGSGKVGSISISGSLWEKITSMHPATLSDGNKIVLDSAEVVIKPHTIKKTEQIYYTVMTRFQINRNLKNTTLTLSIPVEAYGKTNTTVHYIQFK